MARGQLSPRRFRAFGLFVIDYLWFWRETCGSKRYISLITMISGILFDIDGTVRQHDKAIAGAVECLNALRVPYCFVSNNPASSSEIISKDLRELGFRCSEQQVITCSEATVSYLEPGSVYCIGNEILKDLLTRSGFVATEENPKYVIVGYDTECTEKKIQKASQFIQGGAQFVATNPDKIYFTEHGRSPGTGVTVEAVSAASGYEPLMIGKPNRFIVDIALERLQLPPESVVFIGDYLEIDIQAGKSAGTKTALMLTGVSTREDVERLELKPDWILEDFSQFQLSIGNNLREI